VSPKVKKEIEEADLAEVDTTAQGIMGNLVCDSICCKTEEPSRLPDPNPLPPVPPSGAIMETVSADVLTFAYQDLVDATEDFTKCVIGTGGFGIVYKASVRSLGPFAIKKIHKV